MNEIEIKKPKGFLWMDEWAELTADLTNEQIGILLRSAQNFHMGNPYDIGEDKELKMAFRFISICIKQNDEKYDRACKLKKEAREKQIQRRQAKEGKGQDMPTNAEICQDMPTNADYQNTNKNQNGSSNTNQNQNPNKNTIPYKRGEGVKPAPAREVFLETFGLLNNVKMAPEQHRHLVEDYGQEATDATIDDLSCKLADGTVDSNNHYATLLSWLRYQRRNGGPMSMSSAQAQPEPEPKPENDYSYAEECFIKEWREYDKKPHTDADKYWYLNQLAKDGGATPRTLTLIGLKLINNQWLFDNEHTDN